MNESTIEGRDARQRDLVPPDRLAQTSITVIGCGAIGRQAALQLAALGAPHLQLVDFDTVEVENLAPQGFLASDLSRPKVAAVAEQCHAINPASRIDVLINRFNRSVPRTDAVFCCVDSISTRKRIFEQVRHTVDLFLDARMSSEVVRTLAISGSEQGDRYLQTCFTPDQAFAGACTAKSTIYTANIAAGLLVTQFTRWLRRLPIDHDVQLNLLSMELTVG
jgi:sulfur carrier protein ThiS adenylyltransferase